MPVRAPHTGTRVGRQPAVLTRPALRWQEEFGFLRRSMNLVPDAEPTFKPIDLAGSESQSAFHAS
eukprot:29352-Rhodomonas_salina.5